MSQINEQKLMIGAVGVLRGWGDIVEELEPAFSIESLKKKIADMTNKGSWLRGKSSPRERQMIRRDAKLWAKKKGKSVEELGLATPEEP